MKPIYLDSLLLLRLLVYHLVTAILIAMTLHLSLHNLLHQCLGTVGAAHGLKELVRFGIEHAGGFTGVAFGGNTTVDVQAGQETSFGQEAHGHTGGGLDKALNLNVAELGANTGIGRSEEFEQLTRALEAESVSVQEWDGFLVDLGGYEM